MIKIQKPAVSHSLSKKALPTIKYTSLLFYLSIVLRTLNTGGTAAVMSRKMTRKKTKNKMQIQNQNK